MDVRNAGLKILQKSNGEDENAFKAFDTQWYKLCVSVSYTECKQKYCLFTKKRTFKECGHDQYWINFIFKIALTIVVLRSTEEFRVAKGHF